MVLFLFVLRFGHSHEQPRNCCSGAKDTIDAVMAPNTDSSQELQYSESLARRVTACDE
jgi:hypothetical protein